MFGMGFFEIFFILLIAIIVLGPEKLPKAMVEGVKLFRKLKKGVVEAKDVLDDELNIAELKEEANEYKKSLQFTKDEITKNLNLEDAKKEIRNIDSMLLNNTIEDKQEKKKSKKKSKKADSMIEDKPKKSDNV
jgi:sec-independent protein translocase protein TatB